VTEGLTGRTAVVTGTAHGIGAAIAQALQDQGATVHGVDKDVADLTIANGVQFFAAERSSWITGQTISIDGGHALL
jgi:NAD(P)-dependent dehydrogenase (short-subunit alcohol dehydrogenase family)